MLPSICITCTSTVVHQLLSASLELAQVSCYVANVVASGRLSQ